MEKTDTMKLNLKINVDSAKNIPRLAINTVISLLFFMCLLILSAPPTFAQISEQDRVDQAEILILEGEYASAYQIYSDLWAENPQNYDYRLKIGLLLGWMKEFSNSEQHLSLMLNDYPNNVEVGTALMRVLSWQHKYAKSLSLGKNLEQEHSLNPDLLTILAQTNFWSGSYSASRRYANRLLEQDPNNEIGVRLLREIQAINATSLEVGAIFPWDSEKTNLSIYSVRGLTNINLDTQVQLDISQFDTQNKWIDLQRKSWNVSGSVIYQASNKYRLRTDLGVAKYDVDVVGKSNTYLTGGMDFRYNDGKSTVNLTANRYAIMESPILIDNRILFDAVILTYRYRHLNWTLIVDPQYAWISDGNERLAANLNLTFLIETAYLFIRPAIKTRYQKHQESTVNQGYFAPEQLIAGLVSLELDRNIPGSKFQFLLTSDVGYQQIEHFAVNSDPKLLYNIKSEVILTPNNSVRFSAGYSYTNLQTVSGITQDPDYWYQSVFFKLRYIF